MDLLQQLQAYVQDNLVVVAVFGVAGFVLFKDQLTGQGSQDGKYLRELAAVSSAPEPEPLKPAGTVDWVQRAAKSNRSTKQVDWQLAAEWCHQLSAYVEKHGEDKASQALREVVWPAIGPKPLGDTEGEL